MNRRQRHQESGAAEWGPARLLTLLAVSALVALGVLAGLVLVVIAALTADDPHPGDAAPQATAPATGMSRQDALAAAPMPPAEPEAALPGPLATEAAGVLELPRPNGVGPAKVPTGFPRTPEGALAQLVAIDVTAWVKWGVLALIGIGAVMSLGSILVGRIFSHPHASRYGAMGVAVVVMVAITYTVILTILGSITGIGCT